MPDMLAFPLYLGNRHAVNPSIVTWLAAAAGIKGSFVQGHGLLLWMYINHNRLKFFKISIGMRQQFCHCPLQIKNKNSHPRTMGRESKMTTAVPPNLVLPLIFSIYGKV